MVRAYRDACAKYGRRKQLGEDMIWGAGLSLADTPEEARLRVEPSHDERYKWFAPFGFVRYADEHGRTWGTPGAPARVPTLTDGIQQKAWFCGPPPHVIEGIKSDRKSTRLNSSHSQIPYAVFCFKKITDHQHHVDRS